MSHPGGAVARRPRPPIRSPGEPQGNLLTPSTHAAEYRAGHQRGTRDTRLRRGFRAGRTGVYGSNVSSWDGINHYDASNSKWRAIVADGSYLGISPGKSLTYTAGVNIFGLNLTSDTVYNNTHTQKLTAGDEVGQHDIWGAKGPIYGNPGTFHSW